MLQMDGGRRVFVIKREVDVSFKSERISAVSVEIRTLEPLRLHSDWAQAFGHDAREAGRNLPGKASSWEMDPDPIHPQKTEKTNTMADTQNQLWLHIQTLHNVKKNLCVAVVHTPSTGVFKHTSLAVMLYGITKCNIYQRT